MSQYEKDYEGIPEDMARFALYSQTAVNASGLIHSLDKFVTELWEQAHEKGKGTDWVNRHPVLVLFATQLAHLSRCESMEVWDEAKRLCEKSTGMKLADT